MDPKSGYSGLRKMSFESSSLTKLFFLPNFSTAILNNYIKSKKTCPGFLFLVLDLEKIFFFMFSVPCKKKQSYFILLVCANASLLWKSRTVFFASVMFLGMCKVLKDLDKIYWSWSSSKIKLQVVFQFYSIFTTKTGQYPVPLTQDENRLYQKLQRSHL